MGIAPNQLAAHACENYIEVLAADGDGTLEMQAVQRVQSGEVACKAVANRLVNHLGENWKEHKTYAYTRIYNPESLDFNLLKEEVVQCILDSQLLDGPYIVANYSLSISLSRTRSMVDPHTGETTLDPTRKLSLNLKDKHGRPKTESEGKDTGRSGPVRQ